MNTKESFIDFYLSEKNNVPTTLLLSIINANYMAHCDDNSANMKRDVFNFVTEFKKDNENEFFALKDLPIFKFYDIIITERVKDTRNKINSELTIQENLLASELSAKIFSLQKDFIYSITLDNKTFMNFATSEQQLANELKVLLHNKNGVVIFYFDVDNKKYSFGFFVNNNLFESISPKLLNKYTNERDIIFITFENFLKIKE